MKPETLDRALKIWIVVLTTIFVVFYYMSSGNGRYVLTPPTTEVFFITDSKTGDIYMGNPTAGWVKSTPVKSARTIQ